ncbi:hypothetical protein K469DRAFT_713729 [Zopfia rhizophila CBS 207.26]|uniref:Uncharacterized protein n=1 Tax=Zopfia rhizophila CBS 207.26 TaxID=1314779 RepID=A0A6A6DNX9_9PEZI|nr:hypothetical protein K469DRAFT_713729 [Zopfia rhizophila CBS 207.26]
MCTITVTIWECGHIKSRVKTFDCGNSENCLKNYPEVTAPGNCGDSKCMTPPSS